MSFRDPAAAFRFCSTVFREVSVSLFLLLLLSFLFLSSLSSSLLSEGDRAYFLIFFSDERLMHSTVECVLFSFFYFFYHFLLFLHRARFLISFGDECSTYLTR